MPGLFGDFTDTIGGLLGTLTGGQRPPSAAFPDPEGAMGYADVAGNSREAQALSGVATAPMGALGYFGRTLRGEAPLRDPTTGGFTNEAYGAAGTLAGLGMTGRSPVGEAYVMEPAAQPTAVGYAVGEALPASARASRGAVAPRYMPDNASPEAVVRALPAAASRQVGVPYFDTRAEFLRRRGLLGPLMGGSAAATIPGNDAPVAPGGLLGLRQTRL